MGADTAMLVNGEGYASLEKSKKVTKNEWRTIAEDLRADLVDRHNSFLDKAKDAIKNHDEAAALRWLDRVDELERMWGDEFGVKPALKGESIYKWLARKSSNPRCEVGVL